MSAEFPFTVGDKVRRSYWTDGVVTITAMREHTFDGHTDTDPRLHHWSKAGGWVRA
jgi:hypothetical protein